MAQSAMEFIRITAAENFHRLVLSMKSSNSLIMIEATRLLVKMMQNEGYAYLRSTLVSPRPARARTAGSGRHSA
ncbi:MAG: flavodoxin-dependent (E)-4-hydroxy-3-methylbut-2-enyl-diphosphate synthase [Bacteroidales bacterium]